MRETRLREAREAKGLSPDELANLVGCAQNATVQFESGNLEPGLDMVRRLSEALDCPVADLYPKPAPLRRSTRDARITISVRELSARLGISLGAGYNLIRQNRIGSILVGRRYLIPKSSLDKFLASADVAAKSK